MCSLSAADEAYFVSGAGEDVTLNVMADVSRDDYMSYLRAYHGIHIIVHNDMDFVDQTINRIVGQPEFETVIDVSPLVVVSASDVLDMSIARRGCLIDGEVVVN